MPSVSPARSALTPSHSIETEVYWRRKVLLAVLTRFAYFVFDFFPSPSAGSSVQIEPWRLILK